MTAFWTQRHRANLSVAVLLLVFVSVGATSAYKDSITYDESEHLAFGERALEGKLEHASSQKMPITALNALPARLLSFLNVHMTPKWSLLLARLPTLLVATVLGYFIFLWSRDITGIEGGLISLFVFVFCPNILAHARLATTDLYCAAFSFLAVYFGFKYLRTPSRGRLFLAALAMGIAQLSKQTALLLIPLLALAPLVMPLGSWRTRAMGERSRWEAHRTSLSPIVAALAYVAIVVLVIGAGYRFKGIFETLDTHQRWLRSTFSLPVASPEKWPLAWLTKIPLPLPRPYVETYLVGQYYNHTGEGHGPIYLMEHRSKFGWWYYFPAAVLLKIPLPSLILAALALGIAWRSNRLRTNPEIAALLLFPAAIFLYFCFFCTAQIGLRYLLPCMPFAYVFMGQIAKATFGISNQKRTIGVAVMLGWLSISAMSYYPHFISYFSDLCFNRLVLYKYLADSNIEWGQDEGNLAEYLSTHRKEHLSVSPETPTTGTVIVRINELVGVTANPARYQWLRERYTPVSRIGYSILVYNIPSPPPPPARQ